MNPLLAIILVEPENPDNIGAVARAMKNMGLSDLRLVSPPKQWKAKGKKLAMSAEDTLFSAKVFKSVSKAVEDACLVVGTTRRTGAKRGKFLDFKKGITHLKRFSLSQQAAVLFGKESKGLDNESMSYCDWMISIPSDEQYPSLNLSQAVMVVAFSLFQLSVPKTPKKEEITFCNKQEIKETLRHFEKALKALNYEKLGDPLLERIVANFHGIFKRNGMLPAEAQMIKGLARRIVENVINSKNRL